MSEQILHTEPCETHCPECNGEVVADFILWDTGDSKGGNISIYCSDCGKSVGGAGARFVDRTNNA